MNEEVKPETKENYTLFIIIIIVLVLVLGGLCYFLMKGKEKPEVPKEEPKIEEKKDESENSQERIDEREELLLKDADESLIGIYRDFIGTSKSLINNMNLVKLNPNANNKQTKFNEAINLSNNKYYFDLYYTIKMSDIYTSYDEKLTKEEKEDAKNLNKELELKGKISEDKIKEEYNKLFLSSNYIHRDEIYIPGCMYLLYSSKSNTYFIYENKDSCDISGQFLKMEVTSINKNNNYLVFEIYSHTTEDKYKVYLVEYMNKYKFDSFEIVK